MNKNSLIFCIILYFNNYCNWVGSQFHQFDYRSTQSYNSFFNVFKFRIKVFDLYQNGILHQILTGFFSLFIYLIHIGIE